MFKELEEGIKKALGELGLPEVAFSLEHPKDMAYGDYASNVIMLVSKKLGRSLEEDELKAFVSKVQRVKDLQRVVYLGGFINFTLKRDVFVKTLIDAHDKEWGNTEVYKGKKILVEHSSPNLFKPFHIGHLMNNTIGEALYRLAKSSGAQATPISFPSDISLGVAKAVFVLLEKYGEDFIPNDISVLGDAYVEGTKRFEEDESIQTQVKEIADNLYAGKESPEWNIFQKCKKFNIEYFEQMVAKLGSEFDSYIYEGEAGVDGKKIVLENTPKVFTQSDGAIVYIPEEGKKLHTAVFINSQGNPTYEAKDIGLLHLKFNRYQPDLSITITDNQQTSHFQVVVDAAGKINKQWETNSVHRSHGRMSFKGEKMSSRLGNVPLAEDVINTVAEEAKERLVKRESKGDIIDLMTEEQLSRLRNIDSIKSKADDIAIAAIKFTILRTVAGKDINFDPDTSLSFEGDSGPYLQYTAVRGGSLLEKGAALGIAPSINSPVAGTETLERLVARFLEVISRAQTEWAPHHIVTYLSELAQEFNSWYGQGKIIDEDKDATAYRLAVVASVRMTLINGLWVLGIAVPEKM